MQTILRAKHHDARPIACVGCDVKRMFPPVIFLGGIGLSLVTVPRLADILDDLTS
jgi:hypothetical protein